MIYKSIPEIQQIFLGSSTAIGKIFNGSSLVFGKEDESLYSLDYIAFGDPDVKSYIVSQYGSNGEITYAQAAAVTDFSYFNYDGDTHISPFYDKYDINFFEELQYFTGLTTIGPNTFGLGHQVYSIVLPDSLTRIEYGTFYGCQHLANVTLPPNLTYIGNYAFTNCLDFYKIVIPSTVTYIGNQAFSSRNSYLTHIICDATTPPTLGSGVFDNTNDCPIYVPAASVDTYKAATGWSDYSSRIQTLPNHIVFADPEVKSIITTAFGSNGEITEEQAAAVTTWFSGNDSSTNPFSNNASVKYFDEFAYFTGLTSIGQWAFQGCSQLRSIKIPQNVTSIIGGMNFGGCDRLSSITIPNSVTSIGDSAFISINDLHHITIPNSVTSIGDSAFYSCGLADIVIPASVTSIGGGAFAHCSNLTRIVCKATTPPTLDTNGNTEVFYNTNNCPIYVPAASVDTYKAASGWSTYASRIQAIPSPNIVFADSDVKSIIVSKYGSDGEITEEQAAAVTTFMSGLNTTSNPFYQNTDVDSFDEFAYFTGITAIGNFTFYKCTNITSVTIPNGVTSIGTQAFQQCSGLTSVTIPASVTSLGDRCFQSCSALTSITCNATTPPTLGTSVFYSTNCPIYVPSASLDSYKSAWSTYASRIQAKS